MERWDIRDASVIARLHKEIRRSRESRYCHRLHGLLLRVHGMEYGLIAEITGDAPRTIKRWVQTYKRKGFNGLEEEDRLGRLPSLSPEQLTLIRKALTKPPSDYGFFAPHWNGKILSEFIRKNCKISISPRQCQRLMQQFDFRF